jgi:hypothetical protein
MARVIGIDPGTRLCGYVALQPQGPIAAGVARSKAITIAARAYEMGVYIGLASGAYCDTIVVVERPVIYPDSIERDSDQVNLAVTAGIVGGVVAVLTSADELVEPEPHGWKGSTPKHIHNERTQERCPALTEMINATVPKSLRNHVWDAGGLAIWKLERIGQWQS